MKQSNRDFASSTSKPPVAKENPASTAKPAPKAGSKIDPKIDPKIDTRPPASPQPKIQPLSAPGASTKTPPKQATVERADDHDVDTAVLPTPGHDGKKTKPEPMHAAKGNDDTMSKPSSGALGRKLT